MDGDLSGRHRRQTEPAARGHRPGSRGRPQERATRFHDRPPATRAEEDAPPNRNYCGPQANRQAARGKIWNSMVAGAWVAGRWGVLALARNAPATLPQLRDHVRCQKDLPHTPPPGAGRVGEELRGTVTPRHESKSVGYASA